MTTVELFRAAPAQRPGILSRAAGMIAHWAEVRETRNQLNRLTDRELTDIGLSRVDIDRIARGL